MDNQKIASELVDMAERIARKPSEESLQRLAPKGEKAFFAGLANEIAEDLDSSVALDRSLETHYGGTEITLIKDQGGGGLSSSTVWTLETPFGEKKVTIKVSLSL